jgi:hypothetical protein
MQDAPEDAVTVVISKALENPEQGALFLVLRERQLIQAVRDFGWLPVN